MQYLENLTDETLIFGDNSLSIPAKNRVPVWNPEILKWPDIKAAFSGKEPKLRLVED